jgi:hypothetical protein
MGSLLVNRKETRRIPHNTIAGTSDSVYAKLKNVYVEQWMS